MQRIWVNLPLIFAAFSSRVLTLSNLNHRGKGCADPNGFIECYATQERDTVACINDWAPKSCQPKANRDTCTKSCFSRQDVGNLGCWLQSCWNQIFSCEYQAAVIQYLDAVGALHDSALIPFYPPSENAPGSCSCNLGLVYASQTAGLQLSACNAYASQLDSFADCKCCAWSHALSTILQACPDSDLSFLAISAFIWSSEAAYNESSNGCSILDGGARTCSSAYGFTMPGDIWYNPGRLPPGKPGSQTLFNLPGTVTAFKGPAPFTLSLYPHMTVITPVPLP